MATAKRPDRATRFSAELFEAAQAVGARENRSAKQQLEYWARVGQNLTAKTSAAQSRVEAALAGKLERQTLSIDEAAAFDAAFPAQIDEGLASTNVPDARAEQGYSSVYLDDDGQMVRRHPDGTVTAIAVDE